MNEYSFGSFRGDPLELVKSYYDAFVYVANWGTRQFLVRLPRKSLDREDAGRYCVDEYIFSYHTTAEHIILDFNSDSEEPEDWVEGEGWLSSLALLRADIAAGDLRSLYLGWLTCLQEEILHDEVVEPPVPPGLGDLSAPLQALVEFLRIEDDVLQVAAECSRPAVRLTPSPEEASVWLRTMSEAEKDDLLLRLVIDEAQPLQTELRRRIRESKTEDVSGVVVSGGRTVRDLLAAIDRKGDEREQRELQERERQRKEKIAKREAFLDSLAGHKEEIWIQIDNLVEARQQNEYTEAVRHLIDLRDMAARKQGVEDFEARLIDLRARHSRKSSFISRLDQADLRPARVQL